MKTIGPKSVKTLGKSLKTLGEKYGYDLKLTHCQEIITELVNGKSWQAIMASRGDIKPAQQVWAELTRQCDGLAETVISALAVGDTVRDHISETVMKHTPSAELLDPSIATDLFSHLGGFPEGFDSTVMIKYESVGDRAHGLHLSAIEDHLTVDLSDKVYAKLASVGFDRNGSNPNEPVRPVAMQYLAENSNNDAVVIANRNNFEELYGVDGGVLHDTLKEISIETIAKALKTASDELGVKLRGCLATEALEQAEKTLKTMGPVRLSDVEIAQRTIVLAVADKLAADHTSHIRRAHDRKVGDQVVRIGDMIVGKDGSYPSIPFIGAARKAFEKINDTAFPKGLSPFKLEKRNQSLDLTYAPKLLKEIDAFEARIMALAIVYFQSKFGAPDGEDFIINFMTCQGDYQVYNNLFVDALEEMDSENSRKIKTLLLRCFLALKNRGEIDEHLGGKDGAIKRFKELLSQLTPDVHNYLAKTL